LENVVVARKILQLLGNPESALKFVADRRAHDRRKTLLIAERTFRRLDAPELLREIAEGVTHVDGVKMTERQTDAAA